MSVAIRTIQHYMYCARRFALLEINRDWAENAMVVKANLMHDKVHSGDHDIHSKSLISLSNIRIYNDDLDIYGVADCIEFHRNKSGIYISELNDFFYVSIVEYKPTRPKDNIINETDAIQVFAQKLCVDYIWNCNSDSYIYYADVRKRTKLPFENEFDKYYSILTDLLNSICNIYQTGEIIL